MIDSLLDAPPRFHDAIQWCLHHNVDDEYRLPTFKVFAARADDGVRLGHRRSTRGQRHDDEDADVDVEEADALLATVHLSIQEHLCAAHLARSKLAGPIERRVLRRAGGWVGFLNQRRLKSMFDLAPPSLADTVFPKGVAKMSGAGLSRDGVVNVCAGTWCETLRELDLRAAGIDSNLATVLINAIHSIEKFRSLQVLDVTDNAIPLPLRISLLSWARGSTRFGNANTGVNTSTSRSVNSGSSSRGISAPHDGQRKVLLDNKQRLGVALLAAENDRSTTSLDLSGCGLVTECAAWLQALFTDNNLLKFVELAGNRISERGAKHIAEGLLKNTSINHIDLRSNNFGNGGATALAPLLEGSKVLKTVLLGGNSIGNKGGAAIMRAIRQNKVLTVLDLKNNRLGDYAGAAVAETLGDAHTGLVELDLSGNKLGDAAAVAMGKQLEGAKRLRKLLLARNAIGDLGGVALGKMLVVNTSLQILDMAENKLREEAASAFVLALTVNKDLEELELGRNAMTPSAKKGLQKRARVSSGSAQHAFRTLKL